MHDTELGKVFMDATETTNYDSRGLRAVVAAALEDLADRYAAAGQHIGGFTTMSAYLRADAEHYRKR